MSKIKAYYVHEADENYATIVFAESAGKAKVCAQNTDTCEDVDFLDIRVCRLPEADKLYKGKSEIDWYDNETRLIMVKDFGWACLDTGWECDSCVAKQYCSRFEEEVAQ